mmetsp:Transcript_37628/g.61443  ORF Transcript_37628/g.61443 Transcript_37628/m.61443 type:complete len:127 (+) Transcript_37628:845-1225(+)
MEVEFPAPYEALLQRDETRRWPVRAGRRSGRHVVAAVAVVSAGHDGSPGTVNAVADESLVESVDYFHWYIEGGHDTADEYVEGGAVGGEHVVDDSQLSHGSWEGSWEVQELFDHYMIDVVLRPEDN